MDNDVKANKNEDKIFLTQEQRFSETCSAHFFCGNEELDSMFELIWEWMEQVDGEILWYVSFCLAKDGVNSSFWPPSLEMPPAEEQELYRPLWGFRANDDMVLLGLMLLDYAKGRRKGRDICPGMRMSLGQYLDALADISLREGRKLERGCMESFQICRDTLLKDYEASRSLREVLEDILRRYIEAWREFDHLDDILSCLEKFSDHLEREALPMELDEVETVEMGREPEGDYFKLYDRFFLPERDYHPNSLSKLAARAPSSEMRALLEEHICEERLASAMREINKAVTDLYLLFVNPYMQLWKSKMNNI